MKTPEVHAGTTAVLDIKDKEDQDPWGGACCVGTIATLCCCCIPCSVVGLVNVIVARSEFHRGSKRRAQARKEVGTYCIFVGLFVGICLAGAFGYLGYSNRDNIIKSQSYQDLTCLYFKAVQKDAPHCLMDVPTTTSAGPKQPAVTLPRSTVPRRTRPPTTTPLLTKPVTTRTQPSIAPTRVPSTTAPPTTPPPTQP